MRFAALTQQDVLPVPTVSPRSVRMLPQGNRIQLPSPPIGNGAVILRRRDYRGPGPDTTYCAFAQYPGADLLSPPSGFTVMNRTPMVGSDLYIGINSCGCQGIFSGGSHVGLVPTVLTNYPQSRHSRGRGYHMHTSFHAPNSVIPKKGVFCEAKL